MTSEQQEKDAIYIAFKNIINQISIFSEKDVKLPEKTEDMQVLVDFLIDYCIDNNINYSTMCIILENAENAYSEIIDANDILNPFVSLIYDSIQSFISSVSQTIRIREDETRESDEFMSNFITGMLVLLCDSTPDNMIGKCKGKADIDIIQNVDNYSNFSPEDLLVLIEEDDGFDISTVLTFLDEYTKIKILAYSTMFDSAGLKEVTATLNNCKDAIIKALRISNS